MFQAERMNGCSLPIKHTDFIMTFIFS